MFSYVVLNFDEYFKDLSELILCKILLSCVVTVVSKIGIMLHSRGYVTYKTDRTKHIRMATWLIALYK